MEKLKKIRETNLKFHNKMKNLSADNQNIEEIDLDMKTKSTTLIHPFYNEDTEFYQNHTQEIILEKKEFKPKDRPFPIDQKLDLFEIVKN